MSARPDVLALLRACKELPDEDVHRLVLSDWLEDNSTLPHELALRDLIRIQVECDRLPIDEPRRAQLTAQGATLQREHGKAWVGTLDTDQVNWGLIHGMFVMTVLEQNLSNHQLGKPGFQEGWAWVERLTVLGSSESDWKQMAKAKVLADIGTLNLRLNPLGVAGAKALATSKVMQGISGLNLDHTQIGEAGLKAIIDNDAFPQLARLDLERNDLGNSAVLALANWSRLGSLNRLSLAGNRFDDPALAALLDGFDLNRLRELNLRSCNLKKTAIYLLTQTQLNLNTLDLSDNPFEMEGLQTLLSAQWLPNVRRLKLGELKLEDTWPTLLAGCDELAELEELDLSGIRVQRTSLQQVVNSPRLKNLQRLILRNIRAGQHRYQRLRKLDDRPGLTILY